MGGIYWLMVRRGEIKKREKRGFKKLDISSGGSFLCVFTCVFLTYNANAHQAVCVISARSRLTLATITGSTLAKRAPQLEGLMLYCCQPESQFLLFLFFVLSSNLVGKISWNKFAQGAPNCEEESGDAYALKSLCVCKTPAQHFSLPSYIHPCFSL